MSKTKNHPAVKPLREEELSARFREATARQNCASQALRAAIAATEGLPGHDDPFVVRLRAMLNAAAEVDIGFSLDPPADDAGCLLGFALYLEGLAADGELLAGYVDATTAEREANPAFVAAMQGALDGARTAAHNIRILARMAFEGLPPA